MINKHFSHLSRALGSWSHKSLAKIHTRMIVSYNNYLPYARPRQKNTFVFCTVLIFAAAIWVQAQQAILAAVLDLAEKV